MLIGLKGIYTEQIAQYIYQMEGNGPSTIATRNNNPGNLRSGPGQIGTNGGFAVFPDMATGWAALYNQIDLNISRGLTLTEFFAGKPGVYAGYAPASDNNNPVNYANFVAGQIGIDPNVPLNQLEASGGNPEPVGSDDPGTLLPYPPLDTTDQSGSQPDMGLLVAAAGVGGVLLWGLLK